MALNFNGTSVEVSASELPNNYVKPVITKINDPEYSDLRVLNIDKSTVHDSDGATTISNIISNIAIGVDKQVSDIITADFNTSTGTVDAHAEIVNINHNVTKKGVLFTNGATEYQVTVKYSVKVT